jgi:hypothetical protein
MGRWDTGAITTGQCLQLHISAFTDALKQRKGGVGSTSWSSGASIGLNLFYNDFSATLNLNYTKTDRNGEKHNINYNVTIISTPSNLGKGRIYYFVCPFSFKRCKILYMGYGSLYFKSREAYNNRIYYASQLSSRLDKHNDKYWSLEKKLEKLYKKHSKSHYKGKPTKASKRIEWMEEKRTYHEKMRWIVVPKVILKSIRAHGLKDASDLF